MEFTLDQINDGFDKLQTQDLHHFYLSVGLV